MTVPISAACAITYSPTNTRTSGWIVTPWLLPPDVIEGKSAAALEAYSDEQRAQTPAAARFTPFQLMPGNSASPGDPSVCFK